MKSFFLQFWEWPTFYSGIIFIFHGIYNLRWENRFVWYNSWCDTIQEKLVLAENTMFNDLGSF